MKTLHLLSVSIASVASVAMALGPRALAREDQSLHAIPATVQDARPTGPEPASPAGPPSPAPQTAAPASPQDVVRLPEVPVFTARTNLVVLHVNVLDGRRPVPNLTQDAFQVYENGKPQAIEYFGASEVPIAAGLVIDNSTSMLLRQAMVRAGVRAFAESVRENDEMFTIVFNEHVRRGLPASVGFTRSRDQLLAALAVRAPGGLTAVHDAVIEGLSHLTTSSNQKRVLVVLSDGKDNASRLSESNMLYRASQSSAIIYTIWTGDLAQDRGNAGLLKRLARETGGVAYQPKSERDVVDAFGEVAGTIRRSYTIGYTPTNSTADGSYRQVRVDVHTGGRRLTTRARQGYIAPDDNEPRTSAQQP